MRSNLFPLSPLNGGEGQGEGQREKLALIIGFLGDKDWRPMCEILAPLASKIFTVPVASERTADALALADACRAANSQAQIIACKSLAEALEKMAVDEFVVVTGSLYLGGETLELLGLSPAAGGGERPLYEWGVRTEAANKSSKAR